MTWKPQVEHQPSQPIIVEELRQMVGARLAGYHDPAISATLSRAADHIDRLTRLTDAYKGQVEAGAYELAALKRDLADYKQAASVEAGLRREFAGQVEAGAARIAELEGVVRGLNEALDDYWNTRRTDEGVKLICYWQFKCREALGLARTVRES